MGLERMCLLSLVYALLERTAVSRDVIFAHSRAYLTDPPSLSILHGLANRQTSSRPVINLCPRVWGVRERNGRSQS